MDTESSKSRKDADVEARVEDDDTRYGVPVSDDIEVDGEPSSPSPQSPQSQNAFHNVGPFSPTVPVGGMRPKVRQQPAPMIPLVQDRNIENMEIQETPRPNFAQDDGPKVPSVDITDFVSNEYNTRHEKRGRAVIIANIDFFDTHERRSRLGSVRDAELLEGIFSQLQFEPIRHRGEGEPTIVHRNLNRAGIIALMEDATNPDLNDYKNCDCFMCVVLSYGIEGAIMCKEETGDQLMDFNEVVEPFLGSNCPSLIMKPKMFFVQCCPPYERTMADTSATDSEAVEGSNAYRLSLPTHADVLIQFSGLPGQYGWMRRRRQGLSWYIECLAEALKRFCVERMQIRGQSVEFSAIMLRVNKLVLDLIENEGLSASEEFGIPTVKSTLTKSLFFYPKEPSGETAL